MTVFTPFWRVQRELPRRAVLGAPGAADAARTASTPASCPPGPSLADELPEPFCAPGEAAARAAMDALARRADRPLRRSPRRPLAAARAGCRPTCAGAASRARELEQRALDRGGEGAAAFVRQLAWRDFYAHVLLHFPGNARREFQPRYRDLEWDDDPELLEAWTSGRTGYPLVDAGMRQLAATGWMHNRARMVVGSFLTKDLHLDWRAGEAWFERMLLDGEPAQNNGNWQWIASTGVDPAPYFRRMFNPVLQQQKFDPDGAYVRRWVPELRDVPDARLAEPWTMSDAEQAGRGLRDRPRLPGARRRPRPGAPGRDGPLPAAAHRRIGRAEPAERARRPIRSRASRLARAQQQVVEDRRGQAALEHAAVDLLQREVAAEGVLLPRPRHLVGDGGRLERAVGPAEPVGEQLLAADVHVGEARVVRDPLEVGRG